MSSERKDKHVRLALEQRGDRVPHTDFDDVEFIHHALGAQAPAAIDLRTQVLGSTWASPIFINGMTGGSEYTGNINRQLAIAARETGTAIASGSLSVALKDPSTIPSFTVIRREHPDGFILANIGADKTVTDARRAVDILQANALQVHVNPVQETVMPEGERDFSGWLRSIEAIVAGVEVPVVVKEVGFGLSRRTLAALAEVGVTTADVAGRGGTNFATIENGRRAEQDYGYLAGWGQSAVTALLDAPPQGPALIASGGVRHPLDVLRGLALGAVAVGASGSFLEVAVQHGAEGLIARLEQWNDHLRSLLALVGARSPAEARHTDVLLRGSVREFCELRGIDVTGFSQRSGHGPGRKGAPDGR